MPIELQPHVWNSILNKNLKLCNDSHKNVCELLKLIKK
jgi:hypothetical protein